jgi:hypothetical protein
MNIEKIGIAVILVIVLTFLGCQNDDKGSPTQSINHAPFIHSVTASPITVDHTLYPSDYNLSTLSCVATDQDNDSLMYTWSCDGGSFIEGVQFGSTTQIFFTQPGTFYTKVFVSDGLEIAIDSVQVTAI